MNRGSFTIVEYDEESGHMIVDMDHDTVKSLVNYGLNELLRKYCESVLEAETESEETAKELEYGHQLKQEAAQAVQYGAEDLSP